MRLFLKIRFMIPLIYFVIHKIKCISINQFFKDKKGNELTNNVTTCATTELGEDLIKQNIIKEMYDEFDSSYDKTKKQINQRKLNTVI